jgi:hypothetical protein
MHAAKQNAEQRVSSACKEAGRREQDFSLVSTVVDKSVLWPVIICLTPRNKHQRKLISKGIIMLTIVSDLGLCRHRNVVRYTALSRSLEGRR